MPDGDAGWGCRMGMPDGGAYLLLCKCLRSCFSRFRTTNIYLGFGEKIGMPDEGCRMGMPDGDAGWGCRMEERIFFFVSVCAPASLAFVQRIYIWVLERKSGCRMGKARVRSRRVYGITSFFKYPPAPLPPIYPHCPRK